MQSMSKVCREDKAEADLRTYVQWVVIAIQAEQAALLRPRRGGGDPLGTAERRNGLRGCDSTGCDFFERHSIRFHRVMPHCGLDDIS